MYTKSIKLFTIHYVYFYVAFRSLMAENSCDI